MSEKTKLTKAGYKKLEEELRTLIDVTRDEVKNQLAEARAQGDLSENADYDAARAKQAEVEGRIKEIEDILNNCEIIEEGTRKAVYDYLREIGFRFVSLDINGYKTGNMNI